MATRRFDFITGIESSDAPVATDPVNPSDPTTLGFSDNRYVQGGPPVANIAALKAIDVSERQDMDAILVEASNAFFRYNPTATTTPDDVLVVQPTVGAGRWFKVSDLDNFGNLDVPGEINIGGDTTIGGNLTVNGTTTTISTTNLEVEDANILLNVGGPDSTANTAVSGITVTMTNQNHARLGFDDSKASRFKCGEISLEEEIVTTGHFQEIDGRKTFVDYPILFENIASTPSTPASGARGLYSTSTGFKQIDDAGIVSDLGGSGGGSGSGEINTIATGSTATDWVASGAGVTVATTTTAAELPLEGIVSTAIKITPVSGADYVRYRFLLPDSLKNRKLKISWEQLALSGYASGDLKLDIYSNTASDYSGSYVRYALSTDSSGVTSIPNLTGKFQTSFDTDSLDYLELRIVRVSGTTAINLANVVVGPGIQPQGAIVTGEESYIPTFTGFGTVTVSEILKRRVGDKLHISGFFTPGTATGVVASVSLPTGLTIGGASGTNIVGTLGREVGATFKKAYSIITIKGESVVKFAFEDAAAATGPQTPLNGNSITGAGQTLYIYGEIVVPIAEWSGNGVVNLGQNDVEYASNSDTTGSDSLVAFAYGTGGALFPNRAVGTGVTKRVRLPSPIQSTDEVSIEMNFGDYWIDYTTTQYAPLRQGSNSYGARLQTVAGSTTDVDVYFSEGGSSSTAATYAGNGGAWSAMFGLGWKWRVVKKKAGAATGFGIARNGESGLIPYYNKSVVALDGAFTGGNLIAVRVGDMVTLTLRGSTFASGSSWSSSAGLVPSWARPEGNTRFVVGQQTPQIWRLDIGTAGTLALSTVNETLNGGVTSTNSAALDFSVSFALS